MGSHAGWGKVAYIWISPDLVKAGPTLGGGGGVIVACLNFVKMNKNINN